MLLSDRSHEIIRQCLRAAADGPFFPEQAFSTLFGFERAYFKTLVPQYTELPSEVPVHVGAAVHNTLNNFMGYPIDRASELPRWVEASRSEIERAFQEWREVHEYT